MSNALGLGNLVQLRVWCADSEQASVNTFWYVVGAAGPPAATDQDTADQVETAVAGGMKPLIANTALFRGVEVQLHDPTPPPPTSMSGYGALFSAVFQNAHAGAGTAGAVGLPRQTCGLGSFQTGRAGAVGRGRWYAPFPSDTDNLGNGQPTAGYATRLESMTAFFAAGISVAVGGRTATLVRILLHRRNKAGVWPLPSPVLTHSTSAFWATQKRRGDFGRANKSPV